MQVSAFRQSVLMMIMILKPAYGILNYSKRWNGLPNILWKIIT